MRKTSSWNRLLSIMLCICMMLTLLPAGVFAASEDAVAVLDLAEPSNRTSISAEQQIWEANGIKVTNNKAASTSNVGNYVPARFYKSSDVSIEYPGMTKLVIETTAEKYASVWADSYTGSDAAITVDGQMVAIWFTAPTDIFFLTKLSAQTRVSSITVYTGAVEPHVHSWADATCTEPKTCTTCGATEGEVSGHSYDENGICINCDNDYQPCEGSGTDADPYTITNAGQLYWFAEQVNNGNKYACAILTDDIVVNEGVMTESSTDAWVWTPIGNESFWYNGTFDGKGHTISGLYFNDADARYVGLFGTTHDATIENVGVENSCFIANHFVGGVVGNLYMGAVTNCYNAGTVTGGFYVGGVVASAQETTVSNCYNTGTVTATDYEGKVGGVVAYSYGTVTNCYNSGTVNGTREVGGVVGNNRVDSVVSNCYNTADVFGTEYVGGVVGFNDTNGKITNCYYLFDGGIMIGGIDGGDREGSAESKKAAEFASGEVAYLLGEGWGQTIGTDEMPILGGDAVYQITDCSGGTAYSNTDENGTHIWKSADCGAPKTCTACGVTEGEVVGTHVWADATCTEPKNCDVCGMTEGEALGHNFGAEDTCIICGTKKNIHITINMTDKYADGWNGNAINIYEDDVLIGTATIEEGGNAVWTYQGDCTKTYKMEWVLGSWADECSFELLIGDEVVLTASTNECVGYSDGYIIYPVCDHSYDYVVVSPTCTESGYTTYTCTHCDLSFVDNWTNAAGHIAVEGSGVVTEPTCTVDGYTTYLCTTCGESYQWGVLFAQGHSPVEGTGVVTAPTCGEEGYTTYTCETCGGSYTADFVPTLPHVAYDSNGFCTSCDNGYQPCGGNGTENDPYTIGNAGQLYWFAEQVNNGNEYACAILTDDIVVNEGVMTENSADVRTWIMIGREDARYSGAFDGKDHTISGLYFNDSEASYVGLIGFLCEGSVNNVGVINSWLSGNNYVGGVVGEAYKSTVTNCFNSGTIMGSGWNIGGVVGNNNYASVMENCYNTGAVIGGTDVGGVVGRNDAEVTNCYNIGMVDGSSYVGGVAGSGCENCKVTDCYNTGTVSGERDVGGVVGLVAGFNGDVGEITNCYNTGAVKGGSEVGGVSGYNNGSITECYNTGDVAGGENKLGGVVGHNNYGTVTNCYNTGSITGSECIGGVVGDNYESTVMNCYNTGVVTGDNCVGGIAGYDGWNGSTLANCYNMGVVNCETDWFGGVAGYSGGSVINCYYLDDEGLYQGGINVGGPGSAEGKTTAQFVSGEVAFWLGEGWGQTVGTDELPVLGGNPVYRNQVGGCNDYTYVYGYSNTQAEPVITHTFADATCTEPKTCTTCGVIEGQPLGHSYGEDGYCTTCGGHENDLVIVIEMSAPYGHSSRWWDCFIEIYEDGVLIDTATKTDWEDVNLWTYKGDKTKNYTMKWRNDGGIPEYCVFVVTMDDVVVLSASSDDCVGYSDGQIIYPVCTSHNHQTTVVAPTCTSSGYTKHSCTVCGNYYTDNWVDSLGHSPVEGSAVVTPPTCYDWGYTTYTCSVCGETYYSDSDWIENTGHTPAEGSGVVTAPTCGAVGYTTYTCANCGEQFTADEVPALPHAAYDSNGFCLVCDGYQPCGGSGSEDDPYTIGNAGQLYWFAEQVNGQSWLDDIKSFCAILTADIVVNEGVMTESSTGVRVWTPIGTNSVSFRGTFDGAGHTISGLYHFYDVKDEDSQNFGYGLFGVVMNGTVKNVGVINSAFTGWFAVGGVVGRCSNSTIESCFSSCLISGKHAIGGVVGYSDYCTMDNCYNTGTVTSTVTGNEWYAGGVVGNSNFGTITNCYNAGAVTGNTCVGGIAGEANGTTVRDCYSIGAVVGTGENVGGIAGKCGPNIYSCYYLHESVNGANGEDTTFSEAKTAAQFASGEVAFLLQRGYSEQVWGQTIGTDVAPTLGGDTVYQVTNCNGDVDYSNTDEALGHRYVNGICSVCGDVCVSITQKGRTLNYEDLIYVIDIFELIGVEGIDLTKDAGLLIWSVEEFEALSEIVFDADHAKVGLTPYRTTGYYSGSSDGIFTRDLHEEAYYVGYVKLADGSYVYSEPKLYSPAIYAHTMLGKDTTSDATKELCVALLNYISAAQVYFYSTPEEELVNYTLTDEQKALVWNDEISFNLAPEVPADKQVARDENVFTKTGKNLLFEEMISIVSIFMIDDSIVADATESGTIFWTAEQFAALEGAPSIDNIGAGTKVALSQYRGNAGQWCSHAPEVAAKDMADTQYYYLGYVVHADGTVSYSGVISYTVEQYISNTVSKSSTSPEMLAFAQWLYFYERAAKVAIG